ncbi:DUF6233 domain-containing protein [Streptomyces bluensis]|uniref:DUF6233 domain-containing protein n=1 Tax=Streptomyces bluensis TaxID=33897 RepID=A0ABW6UU32_9ACTN
MSDLPPDPERLRVIVVFLRLQLADAERALAEAERRETERQRGVDHRPPPPDWVIDHGLNKDALPVAVHVGGCHMAGKRVKGVSRDAALRALADGVEACSHCRPDAELGYLEG